MCLYMTVVGMLISRFVKRLLSLLWPLVCFFVMTLVFLNQLVIWFIIIMIQLCVALLPCWVFVIWVHVA